MQKIKEYKVIFMNFLKNSWNNHRKKTILTGVFFVVIVILMSGARNQNTETYTAGLASITDQVILSGRTEPVNFVDLGFADSGRVQRVYVTEGQQVQQGKILAELEMGDLSAQLLNARAGLTIAEANARQSATNLEKVTREQNALVETAKRALFGNLEAYPDDEFLLAESPIITGSYQGNESGEYVLEIYASQSDTGVSVRYSGIENGVVPVTIGTRVPLGTKGLFIQFPNTTGYVNTDWTIPIPNIRSAQYPLLLNNYQSAQATRDRVIATAQAEITNGIDSIANARVAQARAAVNQILSAMEKRRIIAPFSGTISQVALKEGESTIGISKDTSPGVSMLATDQYKVVIKIPEIDIARIQAPVPVEVTLDAYGTEEVFSGTLITINPAETIVDGVPVYEGTVLFDSSDERIRSGMTATVTITLDQKDSEVAIPGSYIREDRVLRKYYVTTIDAQGKTQEREVQIGIRGSDGMTEIISGVTEGEILTLPRK